MEGGGNNGSMESGATVYKFRTAKKPQCMKT